MQPFSKAQQLKKVKAPKRKRCKQCKELFVPERDLQPCCGFDCEIIYITDKNNLKSLVESGKANRKKESDKKKKDFKVNDNKNLIEIAQSTVNKYIKIRDKNEPCISCGTFNAKWDAGHYESVGSDKQLRFNTLNIHKQCYYCNCHLSANKTPYRINLVEKIGIKKVEILENDHSTKKYSVEYLQRLIKLMRRKIKLYEKRR